MKREEEAVEEEVLRRNMKMEVGEGVEEAHKVVKAGEELNVMEEVGEEQKEVGVGEEVISRNKELIVISSQVLETQPSFLHQ